MTRNNGLEASLPNPNTSYCYNKNKQYPRSIHSTKAPEKKLSYHNYGWVHSYGWVTWLGSRAQSQQLYRKIPHPNTSSCYNEKKQYHRSLDPQSKHKLLLQFAEPCAQRRRRQCAPTLFLNFPKALARRNARKRLNPPPPLGHGVLDSNFKFLLVFVRS